MSPPPLPGTTAAASQPDFIDVTAKLALVMAALSILYCVIQLGVVLAMGAAGAGSWLQTLELPIPAALQWLIEHAVLLSGLMLLFSLLFLAVSWGLLARREWARQGFIVVLVLTALANFAGLPLINAMFDAFQGIFPAELLQGVEGRELIAQLQISRWTSLIMLALTGLAFSALHGWLVVKLCRRQTRAQFH